WRASTRPLATRGPAAAGDPTAGGSAAGDQATTARPAVVRGLARVARRPALVGVVAVCLVAAGGGTTVYRAATAPVTEAVPWEVAVSPDGSRLYVLGDVWTSGMPRDSRQNRPGRLWILDAASHRTLGDPLP